MSLCRHPQGRAPMLAGSSAAVPCASPVVSHVQEEPESLSCCCPQQFILPLTVEVGLHLFGGLQMLVESRGGGRFASGQLPCARGARGFTSAGTSSGGKGDHGWISVGSLVPHTLPSAVRTAATRGDKVPFRHSGFMHACTRGELARTVQMKN